MPPSSMVSAMIFHLELLLRRLRLLISRSEQAIRLLRLPKYEKTANKPGLIMIQIDGLSFTQLNRALTKKKMPFLRRLIRRERYTLHTMYSGLPSSTPAVQAELFYGVRGAVPAFAFKEKQSGTVVRMYEPEATAAIQKKLETKGTPLLTGGSTYCSIFTGGALESHFCPATLGWNEMLKAARPFSLVLLLLSNAYSFVRVFMLLIIEFFLAVRDFLAGVMTGHDLFKEFKFVPTRVGICILLRELITISSKVDIARGVPVIHLNFLGYDEQAHRRGPSSLFAHWVLKGIDDSIARIWRAAKRSDRRNYDLWVFADHGQESCLSYLKIYDREIEAAVAQIFADSFPQSQTLHWQNQPGIQLFRIAYLGGRFLQRLLPVDNPPTAVPEMPPQIITSMGPLALLYAPSRLGPEHLAIIAEALVSQAHVPLVLARGESGVIAAWTATGRFSLPADKETILGADHPFLAEVCHDLIALCRHPDAGDFILCGWQPGRQSLSFPSENGSHGGPGPEETRAFALLPSDTRLPTRQRKYLRPYDLRQAACLILDRQERRVVPRTVRQSDPVRSIRVTTYNVHSCIGMDGKISPERIARVIAQHEPDIVALQEVDVGKLRTDGIDQANHIAEYLQMDFCFSPTVHLEKGLYGNAILSHLPMQLVKAAKLPGLAHRPSLEPRGALWVNITIGTSVIHCITTHLGLLFQERLRQALELTGSSWLAHPDCQGPLILCGDFNALPNSAVCRLFQQRLKDAQQEIADRKPQKTFWGRYPLARIDHLYISPDLQVLDFEVPADALTRVASDHLPLTVALNLP